MKIVFVASEMFPYAKTGGLADVVGTLPCEIQRLGHEVIAFLPRYKSVDPKSWTLETVFDRLEIPLGTEKEPVRIYSHQSPGGILVYFVDHPEFFCRDGLYGTTLGDYPDNDRRFTLFQRAVLETLIKIKFKSDIIHCHDWQTGLIPVYLKTLYSKVSFFQKTKTVFTVHNLAYQGNFPPDSLPATGLDWDQFRMERLEFYGKVSFLKGAVLDTDALTTVSKRYSREIQKKEFGCGLEGVLTNRSEHLYGIVNGIDYDEWNPETDPDLEANYSLSRLDNKFRNKEYLQKNDGFEVNRDIPLIGIISRLIDQKGIDILVPAIPSIVELGCQFVLLGTGDEKYHQLLRQLAKKYKKQVGVHIVFDLKLAKHMYGGCDLLLIPSYYEPCGLAQMIALRYFTIPIVRETGGLADTVENFDPERGTGNGFSFKEYSSDAMLHAIERAVKIYRNKGFWQTLLHNAGQCDFSWTSSAKEYIELYQNLLSRKSRSL